MASKPYGFNEALEFRLDEIAERYQGQNKRFDRESMKAKVEKDWLSNNSEFKSTYARLQRHKEERAIAQQSRERAEEQNFFIQAYERKHIVDCGCSIETNEPCPKITAEHRMLRGRERWVFFGNSLDWLTPIDFAIKLNLDELKQAREYLPETPVYYENQAYAQVEEGMIDGRSEDEDWIKFVINSVYFQRQWRDRFLAIIRRAVKEQRVFNA